MRCSELKQMLIFLLLLASPLASFSEGSEEPIQTVTGIGGVFFRATDPEGLARWYEKHLGVSTVPKSYEEKPWTQEAGPTVFAPFSKDTKFFGDKSKVWMINFRVNDLDAMVRQLRESGIEVKVDPEQYPNGRFARLVDLEGNPIQLWEQR